MTEASPDFLIAIENGVDYAEVTFTPVQGTPSAVSWHIATLVDGLAMSGDGFDYGDRIEAITTAFYDSKRIDASSITSPRSMGVDRGTDVAVFITWRGEGGQMLAAGAKGVLGQAGFELQGIADPADASRFLSTSGMRRDLDAGVGTTPELLAAPAPSSGSPARPASFTELRVAGFRGFAEERRLRLAQPNGEEGSGLTFLVGANNSGKSTYIEALHTIARGRMQRDLDFPQLRRHRDLDEVTMSLHRIDGRALEVKSIRPGTSQAIASWLPEDATPTQFDVHITPSRRSFAPYFGMSGGGDRNWGLTAGELSRTDLRNQFVGRLRDVNRDPYARTRFDDLLAEIVGERLDWTIDQFDSNQQFVKLIDRGGAWHTSEGLGDGLVSLLFIVDALYDSSPGALIAIDEPELSLHPQLIRRLRGILSRFAAERQILVATHSPLLIDWMDITHGATVARVYKKSGRSEVAQATDTTLRKIAELADHRNLSNPHVVGSIAREAFFLEDGVILTEGQDDVVYLPRVLADLELLSPDNVYGWGAGGATNIPNLASLFIELGFERIGAILDEDGNSETAKAVELLEAMAPQVLVRQIPAPDIRYKKATDARPEVVGLLEKDRLHVRPDLRDLARDVLREVLEHVSPDE